MFMENTYISKNKANLIAYGFNYKGEFFVAFNAVGTLYGVRNDKTSRKHGRVDCLRFRPTEAEKLDFISDGGALCLGSMETLRAWARDGENLGHAFERFMIAWDNGTKCATRAWWNGADYMDKYGNLIQVKFEGGTFCTLPQCEKLNG